MAEKREEEEEPYTYAISLALDNSKNISTSTFNGFLVSVYQAFLTRAEKILRRLSSPPSKLKESSIVLKLSCSFLVLQKFFAGVSDESKRCVAKEVARNGESFLKQLFRAGSNFVEGK